MLHLSSKKTETQDNKIELQNTTEGFRLKVPKINGNTKQESTSGKQLFNKSATPTIVNGVTVTELSTGIRVTSQNVNANSNARFLIKDISSYVGKVIRLKSTLIRSNNNIQPRFYIGICDSNGDNRSTKATGSPTTQEISWTVTNDMGDSHYLMLWFYPCQSATPSIGDYTDFTNLILTIDNEDMSYEQYTRWRSSAKSRLSNAN